MEKMEKNLPKIQFSHKKKFFLLLLLFSVFFSLGAADDKKDARTGNSVIKIEHAQKTEYKKDKEDDEDLVVLTGEVQLSVTKGNAVTIIKAGTINFNRATNMLYAEGDVSLSYTDSSSGAQTISSSSLLFNTVTFAGIFDNGKVVQTSSDALNLPSGSTLIVSSEIFGKDSGGTVAFKSGNVL